MMRFVFFLLVAMSPLAVFAQIPFSEIATKTHQLDSIRIFSAGDSVLLKFKDGIDARRASYRWIDGNGNVSTVNYYQDIQAITKQADGLHLFYYVPYNNSTAIRELVQNGTQLTLNQKILPLSNEVIATFTDGDFFLLIHHARSSEVEVLTVHSVDSINRQFFKISPATSKAISAQAHRVNVNNKPSNAFGTSSPVKFYKHDRKLIISHDESLKDRSIVSAKIFDLQSENQSDTTLTFEGVDKISSFITDSKMFVVAANKLGIKISAFQLGTFQEVSSLSPPAEVVDFVFYTRIGKNLQVFREKGKIAFFKMRSLDPIFAAFKDADSITHLKCGYYLDIQGGPGPILTMVPGVAAVAVFATMTAINMANDPQGISTYFYFDFNGQQISPQASPSNILTRLDDYEASVYTENKVKLRQKVYFDYKKGLMSITQRKGEKKLTLTYFE